MTNDPNIEDPDTPWPPTVGGLLPHAADAYAAPEKLAWILGEEGHGREWARVLHIGPDNAQRFWSAIADAVLDGDPIFRVTERDTASPAESTSSSRSAFAKPRLGPSGTTGTPATPHALSRPTRGSSMKPMPATHELRRT